MAHNLFIFPMRQALLLLALFSPSLMSAALEYRWTSPVFLAEGHTFLVSRENGGGGLVVTLYVPFSELADTIRLDLLPLEGVGSSKISLGGGGGEQLLDSRQHMGIELMSGTAAAIETGSEVAMERGSASIAFDTDDRTFTGSFSIGSRSFSVKEDLYVEDGEERRMMYLVELTPTDSVVEEDDLDALPLEEKEGESPSSQPTSNSRRRSIPKDWWIRRGSVCRMKLIVDNDLFYFWRSDLKMTTKNVLGMLESANRVYREQGPLLYEDNPVQFRADVIMVATDDFCRSVNYTDYRCRTHSNHTALLLDFSQSEDFSSFCLAFLLSGSDLTPTLGFSYLQGVCLDRAWVPDAHSYRSRNSGLVTVLRRTLDRAEYVLAHELAHSLGAEHDPPLAPYIMAPQAPETITLSGETFSNASLSSMHDNLHDTSKGVNLCFGNLSIYNRCSGELAMRNWCFERDPMTLGGGALVLTHTTSTTTTTPRPYYEKGRRGGKLAGLIFVVILVFVVKVMFCLVRMLRYKGPRSRSRRRTGLQPRGGQGGVFVVTGSGTSPPATVPAEAVAAAIASRATAAGRTAEPQAAEAPAPAGAAPATAATTATATAATTPAEVRDAASTVAVAESASDASETCRGSSATSSSFGRFLHPLRSLVTEASSGLPVVIASGERRRSGDNINGNNNNALHM